MFRDAVEFFFTPTTPIARRYGFLHQTIALKHRFERCKKFWLPHLQKCQETFLEVVQTLPKKEKVVILGSAHLHEIPMHLLLQHFQSVVLVDLIHPLKHHTLAKKDSRIQLVTHDVSGLLENLDACKNLEDLDALFLQAEQKSLFQFQGDLIVSGNLLSQLSLLPLDFIAKKMKRKLTLEEKDIFCSRAAQTHLKNLEACRGELLIYSDRHVTYKGKNDEILYQGQYAVDFSRFKKFKEWTWQLAPLGEASKDYAIEMKVEAYLRN